MFTSNKNDIKKEKNEIITKSSNLASRKAMFEKKSNISHANTLQENPPIKKIYNPNILNNPKFSNVVRVMSDKKNQESKKEEIKIEENKNDEVSKIEEAMKGELKSLGSQLQELEKIKLIK